MPTPTTTTTPAERAAGHLRALSSNVNAWYMGTINRQEFDAAQIRRWDLIHADGPAVEALVLAELRMR